MTDAVFCHHLHEFGYGGVGCAGVDANGHDVTYVHANELVEFAGHCANDIAF